MVDLSMRLHAMVFSPGDTPPIGYLYIVHRGIALYRARLVTKGRVWGEDMLLHSDRLREVRREGRRISLFIVPACTHRPSPSYTMT